MSNCLKFDIQMTHVKMPWWPTCLDYGALINVDAPAYLEESASFCCD